LGPARPGELVEDRYPQRWNPALDRITSIDRHPALNPTVDGDSTVHPALDRVTAVNPTIDGIETLNGEPSFGRVYTLNQFAQP